MTNNAALIKQALAEQLALEGKTLQDLENDLYKQSSLQKTAAPGFLISLKDIGSGLGSILSGTGGAVAGIGIGAGLLGYGGYLANEDSNKKILKKLREKQQYLEAAKNLQDSLQSPTTL